MSTKQLFYTGIILSALLTATSAAATEPDERRDQLRGEAQASHEQVKLTLSGILEKVNLNQRPTEAQIQSAAELLETNRRNATAYDSAQKAGYMLLQSWISYYQKDPVANLNWAVRACREDMTNGDAWNSQTLFSFIYGRRPVEPQAPRPQRPQPEARRQQQPRPQPRGGRQAETIMEAPAMTFNPQAPFGQPGMLNFDLNMLRRDFFRERFARMELQTVENKKIVYNPAADVLCILFWQAEEVADPNAPGARKPAAPTAANREMEMAPMSMETTAAAYSLDNQQAYFEVMMDVLAAKKEVKFVEINTNSQAAALAAMKNHKPVAPLVAAALPQSGAAALAKVDVKIPFMAIIDKEGQVKYAGVADGFMPAFILTHITGTPIDLEAFIPANSTFSPMEMRPPMMPEMMMQDPFMMAPPTPADPNHPGAQTPPQKQYRELSEHQKLQAETQLGVANDLFGKAAARRMTSYKNYVEICRGVIRNYPDTIYAEQARQMLRKVPERQRAAYNITDAEVGQ